MVYLNYVFLYQSIIKPGNLKIIYMVYEEITRNTSEIIKPEELKEIIQKDNPSVYIGYAPTGSMHIGHFTTIAKTVDFIDNGFKLKILLADVHAELDIEKTDPELVESRTEYYKEAIQAMLAAAGIDKGYEFVVGSDFQFDKEYQKNVMRMMENASITRAKRAVSEVVRHKDSMKSSALLYCYMQIQDVIALDADVAFSGLDQRRIYMLGRDLFSKLDMERDLTCVFAPLLASLTGGKMSSSQPNTKISIHDSPEELQEKMNDAFCPQGEAEDNGVLQYTKVLLFPILERKQRPFIISRPKKYGGTLTYEEYEDLEKDFVEEKIHPLDLKKAVGQTLAAILAPVRNQVSQEKISKAYPDKENL